jgi:hypothetical protein
MDIAFKNLRISSIDTNSGIFAGINRQNFWLSEDCSLSGFGSVSGECNTLKEPRCAVTDAESSKELLEYFEKLIAAKLERRDK